MHELKQATSAHCDTGKRATPSRASLLVAAMILLACTACGRSNLHRVSGRVHFSDGTPLSSGRVAIDFGNGRSARGRINADGTFRMGTLKDRDGMRPGTWQVAILDSDLLDFATGKVVHRIHDRFKNPKTSGLSFTVPDQMTWDVIVEPPQEPPPR